VPLAVAERPPPLAVAAGMAAAVEGIVLEAMVGPFSARLPSVGASGCQGHFFVAVEGRLGRQECLAVETGVWSCSDFTCLG
jgi:hypothetical protein